MIIQIRGTSGSGKTWIVNRLMKKHDFRRITSRNEVMGYYCQDLNLFIVGKYETACGGCDSIKTQDEICNRIRKAYKQGWNVLFEGLLCSHISGRYAELYKESTSNGNPVRYIFLDTPLEKCRENINARRIKAGKQPTMAKNTEKDYVSAHKSRINMNSMGVPFEDMPELNSKDAYKYIVKETKIYNNKED